MASNTYTTRITQNKDSKIAEYTSGLAQLKADIKGLNLTVDKTINTEIDRLIPQSEKKRFMKTDMANKVNLDRKIASLKPSSFFEMIGESADTIAEAERYALSAMKPSDIEKPEGITDADWKTKSLAEKKQAYYNEIKTSNQSKLEELVFKGMPESKKRAKITKDANIYFDMLSRDKKLELIARYGEMEDEIEGEDDAFEDKLGKAQKRKDQLKASIKAKANALIKSMQNVIVENANEIKKLQEKIAKEENELNELKTKEINISEFADFFKQKNPKTPVPDVDTLKDMARKERDAAITAKETIIAEMKTDLGTAITEQNNATIALEKAIKDIENTLAEKDIYVGSQSINENSPTQSQNNSVVQNTNSGNTQASNKKMSQARKAGNMLKDMIGTKKDTGSIDIEDFKDMLHSNSYEEMVAMAKQLKGPIKKGDLTKFYDLAWKDLKHQNDIAGVSRKIDSILGAANIGINLEDLKDITSIGEDKIENLQYILQDYLKEYSNKTKEEQETIDALMDYVKIGILRRQAEHFKGIKDLFTNKNVRLRIGNFTRLLEKHAEKYYNRESGIYNRVNTLREKLKLPPIDVSKKVSQPKKLSKNKPTEHTL